MAKAVSHPERRRLLSVAACLLLLVCTGCSIEFAWEQPSEQPGPPAVTPRSAELPVCNLPPSLRVRNYKGGSCVHASTGSAFNWLGLYSLQRWWNATYSGGESYNGLVSKLQRAGIPFYSTASGDVATLERCTRERRMATIFFYSAHSVSFNGFGDGAVRVGQSSSPWWNDFGDLTYGRGWDYARNPAGKFAYLLDNNRTGAFIEIPREEYLRKWRGYGGVAVVPTLGAPAPPLPFVARN